MSDVTNEMRPEYSEKGAQSPDSIDITTPEGFSRAIALWNHKALRGECQPFELAQAVSALTSAQRQVSRMSTADKLEDTVETQRQQIEDLQELLEEETRERKQKESKLAEFCERILVVVDSVAKKQAETVAKVAEIVDILGEMSEELADVSDTVNLIDVEAGERIGRLETTQKALECGMGLVVLDATMTSSRLEASIRAGQNLERNVANLDESTRAALKVADEQHNRAFGLLDILDRRMTAAYMNDEIRMRDIRRLGEECARHRRHTFERNMTIFGEIGTLKDRVKKLEPKEETKKLTGTSVKVTMTGPDGKEVPVEFKPRSFPSRRRAVDPNCNACRSESGQAFFLSPPPHSCGRTV